MTKGILKLLIVNGQNALEYTYNVIETEIPIFFKLKTKSV